MKLHIYVEVPASHVAPGQTICVPGDNAHDPTGPPQLLLTVEEVRRTLAGYEFMCRRVGVTSGRRTIVRHAGADMVRVEPTGAAARNLLATMNDHVQTSMGRSAKVVGVQVDGGPPLSLADYLGPQPASNGSEEGQTECGWGCGDDVAAAECPVHGDRVPADA